MPKALCGGDQGPSPCELFLGSIAADLLNTMITRACELDLDIGEVEATVEAPVNLRASFGVSEEVARGFHAIHVKVRPPRINFMRYE